MTVVVLTLDGTCATTGRLCLFMYHTTKTMTAITAISAITTPATMPATPELPAGTDQ